MLPAFRILAALVAGLFLAVAVCPSCLGGIGGSGTRPVSCDFGIDDGVNAHLGVLTVGVPRSVSAPWFLGTDYTSGQGFESALVYEIADLLGIAAESVAWLPRYEDAAEWSVGEFDFALGQFTDSESLSPRLSFSEPYYEFQLAVITARDQIQGLNPAETGVNWTLATTDDALQLALSADWPGEVPRLVGSASVREAIELVDRGDVGGLLLPPESAYEALIGSSSLAAVSHVDVGSGVHDFRMLVPSRSSLKDCLATIIAERGDLLEGLERRWLLDEGGSPHVADS